MLKIVVSANKNNGTNTTAPSTSETINVFRPSADRPECSLFLRVITVKDTRMLLDGANELSTPHHFRAKVVRGSHQKHRAWRRGVFLILQLLGGELERSAGCGVRRSVFGFNHKVIGCARI